MDIHKWGDITRTSEHSERVSAISHIPVTDIDARYFAIPSLSLRSKQTIYHKTVTLAQGIKLYITKLSLWKNKLYITKLSLCKKMTR